MDDVKAAPNQAALAPAAPDEVASDDPINSLANLLAEAERVSHELAALADRMVAQAESSSRDAQRLIVALTEATAILAQDEAIEASPPPREVSDGARMLARQMLAGGSDRASVEENLRTSFGVRDAAAVVDSLVAPERA
jgi:hypothetical protein